VTTLHRFTGWTEATAHRLTGWAKRTMRLAQALALDPRFPRPLRWAIRVALAVKLMPFPDFGIDEAILIVAGAILWQFYRPELLAVIAETKEDTAT